MEKIEWQTVIDWNIEELTGYKPISTFYTDFSIADRFGISAIVDTYERAFKVWKSEYKMLTELVMVLNWKIWEHYETNEELAEIYSDLWTKADHYAMSHLKGDELKYFLRTTD